MQHATPKLSGSLEDAEAGQMNDPHLPDTVKRRFHNFAFFVIRELIS